MAQNVVSFICVSYKRIMMVNFVNINRVFSCDVTAAMLVYLNKGTAAMLVSLNKGTAAILMFPTNPPGIEHYSYANVCLFVFFFFA